MSNNYSVTLAGPAPWGFRLQGGKDFCLPLTISRLTEGGKAAKAKMSVGDVILSINGIATDSMNHLEAQNKIKGCTSQLSLTLQRATSGDGPPKGEPQEIIKPVPIAHTTPCDSFTKPSQQPSAAYNKTARPFGGDSGTASPSPTAPMVASIPSESSAFVPAAPSQQPLPPFPLKSSLPAGDSATANSVPRPSSGRSAFTSPSASASSSNSSSPARVTVPSTLSTVPQPSVYNSPINLYSNLNACEVAAGQRRGLLDSQELSEQFNGKTAVVAESQPQSVLGDPSKKRLIEDTEDWHPRSGTSQSRSFRILAQLTGTENEKVSESSGKNEADEDVVPCAYTSPSVKTFTKGAVPPRNGNVVPPSTGKTPASQSKQPGGPTGFGFPRGGAMPSFGKVTGTIPTGPDRPTPQPHPEDLNSVVQRAEHIPAGKRTPMCNKCNSVIRGPFLVAMGMSWHPEEFNCSHCRASLVDRGFVEEKGQVYCEHCYEAFLAPTCTRCQQKILGEVMNALKQTWHVYCFVCAACQQPIRGSVFHMEDGKPYCEQDYYNLFGTNCNGCQYPIEAGDKFLEALGFTWHDTCFVCVVCSTNLEGQAFFSKKDKPLCKKHAHTVKI